MRSKTVVLAVVFLTVASLMSTILTAEEVHVMPLETGQVFTYERTDSNETSWIMTWEIGEKVMIDEDEYFRFSECNYYPDHNSGDEYLRSSDEAVYVRGDNNVDILLHLRGFVDIYWTFDIGEGYVATRTIDRIEEVNVPYGGPYQAYVYQNEEREGEVVYNSWEDYLVPGLGVVQIVDYIDPDCIGCMLPVTTKLLSITPDEACGSSKYPIPEGDINRDCRTDLFDFAVLADHWLEDNNP